MIGIIKPKYCWQVIDKMNKFKNIIQTNQAFTLIEVILTIAILGIVTPMILSMITDIYSTVIPNAQRMHAKENAQLNLSKISRHIRNTDSEYILVDQNKVNCDDITIEYNANEKQIEINDSYLKSVKSFSIEKRYDKVYEIKIEKYLYDDCKDDSCDTITMQTIVKSR